MNGTGRVAALTAAVIIFGVLGNVGKLLKPSVQEEIEKACREVNQTCPRNLDASTRLDKAEPEEKGVIYYYTLRGITPDMLTEEVKQMAGDEVIKAANESAELEAFRKNKLSMTFVYSSEAGEELYRVTWNP